jgi:MtN3 and saliva related transmembrane protein
MSLGQRHLHARRRVARQLEPFPSHGFRKYFDYLMYGVGIIMPIALVPQVSAIYIRHDVAGISLATWLLLTFFNVLWAIYGLLHKDPPIFIANTLLALLDVAIVAGVLYYGG